jgi:hypothetical protein
MPILAFFAVVGSVLVALLFVADATLEENGAPVIVTSQRTGLPTPRYHNANAIKTPTILPAPAPDMTSQAVLTAQPKSAPKPLPKIEFEAREARAEVPPKMRGRSRQANTRGPKRHPKFSASRSPPTPNRRSSLRGARHRHPKTTNRTNSTDFLLRVIRAGPLRRREAKTAIMVGKARYQVQPAVRGALGLDHRYGR